MINLLFVTSFFYPDTMGGSDRYIYEVARRLVKEGHRVSVLTANPGDLRRNEIIEGINVYRYRVNRASSIRYYLSSIFNSQSAIFRLVKEETFDALILNHILPSLGAFLANKNIPNTYHFYAPYVLEFQDKINWEITQHPGISTVLKVPYLKLISFFLKRIEKYIVWKSKRILVLSDYSKEQVSELYRQAQKVTIIPSGIDTNRFNPNPEKKKVKEKLNLPTDRPLLLTIRRLYHRMGIEELILALKEIRQTIPNILLLIGGQGPLRENLEKLVSDNQLQDNIKFLGFIQEEQITDYYNAADYFILPTRALEGFGMVTIEALACGIPVLGTPIGATAHILENLDPVLLFEDATATAISKKVIAMFKDYPDYSSLSQRCREYILNNYSWDEIMPKITEFYQQGVL